MKHHKADFIYDAFGISPGSREAGKADPPNYFKMHELKPIMLLFFRRDTDA